MGFTLIINLKNIVSVPAIYSFPVPAFHLPGSYTCILIGSCLFVGSCLFCSHAQPISFFNCQRISLTSQMSTVVIKILVWQYHFNLCVLSTFVFFSQPICACVDVGSSGCVKHVQTQEQGPPLV